MPWYRARQNGISVVLNVASPVAAPATQWAWVSFEDNSAPYSMLTHANSTHASHSCLLAPPSGRHQQPSHNVSNTPYVSRRMEGLGNGEAVAAHTCSHFEREAGACLTISPMPGHWHSQHGSRDESAFRSSHSPYDPATAPPQP